MCGGHIVAHNGTSPSADPGMLEGFDDGDH